MVKMVSKQTVNRMNAEDRESGCTESEQPVSCVSAVKQENFNISVRWEGLRGFKAF